MKNKWLIVPIIFGGVIVAGWIIARLTGALQIYRIPTPSSEPTIQVGDIVFTSILKKPSPGNTVAYKNEYSEPGVEYPKPGEIHLHRLVADEGDILEMKDGVLFLNRKNFDAGKNLLCNYLIDKKALAAITNIEELEEKQYLREVDNNMFEVFLTSNEVFELNKKGVATERVVYRNMNTIMGAYKWINKDSAWSIDNFGPLKIPEGHFFVLGDNRHNSLDSRYVGFIKKENWRGTVLGK